MKKEKKSPKGGLESKGLVRRESRLSDARKTATGKKVLSDGARGRLWGERGRRGKRRGTSSAGGAVKLGGET